MTGIKAKLKSIADDGEKKTNFYKEINANNYL